MNKNWYKSKKEQLEGYVCSVKGCDVDLGKVEKGNALGDFLYYRPVNGEIENAVCQACYQKMADMEKRDGRRGRKRQPNRGIDYRKLGGG